MTGRVGDRDVMLLLTSEPQDLETQRLYDRIFNDYEADPDGIHAIPHDVVMRESQQRVANLVRERQLRGWS